jgi:glucose/arabinose dehydrogenase
VRSITRWPAGIVAFTALLSTAVACGEDGMTATLPTSDDIVLTEVAAGLERPVQLVGIPDDSRLFIVEQRGRIRVLAAGQLRAEPYLDIGDQLSGGNEQGLLGVAFHPDFPSNGYVYANYTNPAGDTRVVRYTESADGFTLDPATLKEILFVEQPNGNHNAGQLLFGPDGMLYVPLGDGGSSGDPRGNGQNLETLLGSILRIDVDGGDPYTIPPDNPFFSGGGRPEIWAYGVRNPWRNDIDFEGEHIYVADVGQNEWEEVSVAPLNEAGVNYGWNTVEGPDCFRDSACDRTGIREPVIWYGHGDGCSISGGHVYWGDAMPGLTGTYFYSDHCSGWLRSFLYDPAHGAAVDQREWSIPAIGRVYSFGRDADGELYILAESRAYRIDPAP